MSVLTIEIDPNRNIFNTVPTYRVLPKHWYVVIETEMPHVCFKAELGYKENQPDPSIIFKLYENKVWVCDN
jgi:hypothetical protein